MGILGPATATMGEGDPERIRLFTASSKGLAQRSRSARAPEWAPCMGSGETPRQGFPRLVTAGLMSSSASSGKTPARVTFSYLTPNNLGVVRKLNSVLFPIKYAEKYYKDILAPEVEDFCQLGERAHLITSGKSFLAPLLPVNEANRKEHSVLQ